MKKKPDKLKDIIDILELSKTDIATLWMKKPSVITIFTKHKISRKKFIPLFAEKVIGYFIDVLKGVKEVGNCPVMNKFIDYMSDKEISVKEIFLICMAFRRSMFTHLIEKKQLQTRDTTILERLSEVFDQNLSGVLDYFTQQDITRETEALHEHDQEEYAKRVQTILDIQDHMILTIKEGEIVLANRTFLHAFDVSDLETFYELFTNDLDFIEKVEQNGESYITEGEDAWLAKVADSVDQIASIHFFNKALQKSQPYRAKIHRMPGDEKESFVMSLGEFSECDERIFELSQYVYKDSVTDLYNRRKFDESMEMLVGQCHNSAIALSMIVIDLGDLKNIYEMYGREKGDEIIKEFGRTVDDAFGHLGLFARIDNDRFGLLLKEHTLKAAIETAQTMHTLTKNLRSRSKSPMRCNIAVVYCQESDTEQTMFLRADRLIKEIIQNGGGAIKDDQTLLEEENRRQKQESSFLKECIEMKAADKTLDVVNYFNEVPIQSKSVIIGIKQSTITIAMRKIAINALHNDAFIYIQTPRGDKDIKAMIKKIDNDKFTITVDRFAFVKNSPLDRKTIHVTVEEDIGCFIKMDETQIKGILESVSTDTAMIILPHIHGISMDKDVLLDTSFHWDGNDEHLRMDGKLIKVVKIDDGFKVIINLKKNKHVEEVLTPYIAHRQLEIIKVLQRSAF